MLNSKEEEDFWCYCVSGILGGILGICFLAYLVVGIVFLVQDYNIWDNCHGSNLWPYVLVSLLCTINKGNYKDINDNGIPIVVCCFCIELGLSIWGGIELFDLCSNCNELENSNLWIYGVVTFSIQLLTIILIIFIPLIYYKFTINDIEVTPEKTQNKLESNINDDIESSNV